MKQKSKRNRAAAHARVGRGPDFRKREAILHAAYEGFLSHGPDVSVHEIARNAGVSKQTIYNAFPTKHDLFMAGAVGGVQKVTENLKKMAENENDPRDVLIRTAEEYCRITLDKGCLNVLRKLLTGDGVVARAAKSVFNAGPEEIIIQLAYYLEQASLAGKLSVKNPFLSAEFFLGGLRGYVRERYWLKSTPPPAGQELRARVDYAVSLFLAAHK